jgi:hypothetical protein
MNRPCLAFALCALLAPAALAQSTNSASATPPAHTMNRPPPLTKDQNDEVNKAYADAIKANPDLASEQKDLADKQKALADEKKAFQQKLDDALVKADPNLADVVKDHPNLNPRVPAPPKTPPAPKPPKTPKPAKPKSTTPGSSTNAAPAKATPPPAAGN